MTPSPRHRCMRCGREFVCPSPPGGCTADYDVLPRIPVHNEHGRVVGFLDHCVQDGQGRWMLNPDYARAVDASL